MTELWEFIKGFNLQSMLSMVLIFWYFSRYIETKIQSLENRISAQALRTDRLHEKLIDLLNNREKDH